MTGQVWSPVSQSFDPAPSLAEFLLGRIAEDEADAHATRGVGLVPDFPDGCWTERRVLAECEAKRRVVGLWDLRMSEPEPGFPSEPLGGQGAEVYYDALKALALPYVDHPEFREEWKP